MNTYNELIPLFSTFPIEWGDTYVMESLACQWVESNISVTNITENKISVSWNRGYSGGGDDYMNSGRITCDITYKNLCAIIDNDIEEIEGDYEYFFQY